MIEFELEIFQGHPIIREGENIILLDTGSPTTIHTHQDLTFCDEQFRCETNHMGILSSQDLSELLGTRVTTLLGTNCLSHFKVLLDYSGQKAKFMGREEGVPGTQIYIDSLMGVPLIEVEIANQIHKLFLDTGAKLSYLDVDYTGHLESQGTEQDFYPGLGAFTTPVYEITTHFEGYGFSARYGNLPTIMAQTLRGLGINGILGYDFFNKFKVCLDLKDGLMGYELNK